MASEVSKAIIIHVLYYLRSLIFLSVFLFLSLFLSFFLLSSPPSLFTLSSVFLLYLFIIRLGAPLKMSLLFADSSNLGCVS